MGNLKLHVGMAVFQVRKRQADPARSRIACHNRQVPQNGCSSQACMHNAQFAVPGDLFQVTSQAKRARTSGCPVCFGDRDLMHACHFISTPGARLARRVERHHVRLP